ncbi:MAG: hypothetical protein PVI86_04315 [Phycisphaerae bacterium]|jgi:hypothetical protein
MKARNLARAIKLLAPGLILLQAAGCTMFNETLQTIFLGITAAGSIAIIQNI